MSDLSIVFEMNGYRNCVENMSYIVDSALAVCADGIVPIHARES